MSAVSVATTSGAPVSPAPTGPQRIRIRLWDVPVRVFHWSLVAAVTTAVVTGELGGAWMTLHGQAGLTIVGLIVFRVVWGVIGSTHARFVRFVPTPRSLAAYLRGRWTGVGHNPLGALSVLALLALLAAQAGTGLFSNDDIAFSGPLFGLIDESLASRLTGIHKQLATVLFVLAGLHIVAIVFYVAWKKHDLVRPMVTGWKEVEAAGDEPARQGGPIAFAVALALAIAAVLAVKHAGQATTGAAKPAAAVVTPKPAW